MEKSDKKVTNHQLGHAQKDNRINKIQLHRWTFRRKVSKEKYRNMVKIAYLWKNMTSFDYIFIPTCLLFFEGRVTQVSPVLKLFNQTDTVEE